jgi:hypothetical protein
MTEPLNGEISIPTVEDLKYIREKLRQDNDPPNDLEHLERRIMFVIKHGGIVSGCIAARLVWQIEPLYITPELKRDAGPVTVRRAVFKLCRKMMEWLGGPENKTGITWTFCYTQNKNLQGYVQEYGFLPCYSKGKFFVRDF